MQQIRPEMLFEKLFSEFGAQKWWPVTDTDSITPTYKQRKRLTGQQKFEICVGAILTQNTAWTNVSKALEQLNKSRMLSCRAIAKAKHKKLAVLIRSSGYYNQKALRLKNFSKYLEKNYNCSIEKLLAKPLAELRKELLSLNGVGKETADSIILFAAGKPVFVVDAYTKRLAERLKLHGKFDYDSLQEFFDGALQKDARLFNEFHALIVRQCKENCKKKPACENCCLKLDCAFRSQ